MPIKVLSIDDGVNMTKLLGILLHGHGMNAISTNNSELGLELARREKPGRDHIRFNDATY